MTTTEPQASTPDIHRGFRLTKVTRMKSPNGIAFTGTLTLDGAPVADVHQDGNGGPAFVDFTDGYRSAARVKFEAAASEIFGADRYEPTESLLWRLEAAEKMGRARSIAFVLSAAEVDDFWSEEGPAAGVYRQIKGSSGSSLDTIREYLDGHYPNTDLHVWSKDAANFVPIAQA